MQLAVCAQDIRSITYAALDGGQILHQETLDARPQEYLSALDTLLQTWSLSLLVFKGLVVVTGPGSFTASRVSTTIANTIAFVHQIPIQGLENPDHIPLQKLLSSFSGQVSEYVMPSYDRPPNITKSRPKSGDKKRD
jgi:hypothetical protein